MRGRWHVCYGSGLSIIYIYRELHVIEVHVHWQLGTLSTRTQVVIRTGDIAIKTCHELIPEVMP